MTVESEPQRFGRGASLAALGAVIGAIAAILAIARMWLAKGTRIRMSITIDRPVGAVFAFVADARNAVEWLPAAVERRKTTEGPIGVGTRFEATDRIGGQMVDHTQEIIEYEPDRTVTTRISAPWNGDYEIRAEPSEGGTLLSVDTSGRPSGLLRLFSLVPAAMMERSFEQDYARLKDLLEGRTEPITIPIEPEAEPIGAVREDSLTT